VDVEYWKGDRIVGDKVWLMDYNEFKFRVKVLKNPDFGFHKRLFLRKLFLSMLIIKIWARVNEK
jgi:hypothetical protein